MKKLLMTLCLIAAIFSSMAQNGPAEDSTAITPSTAQSVFLANDIFLTLSINYEKRYQIAPKAQLGWRLGLGRDYGNKDNTAIVEGLFVYGRTKHFLEAGIAYQHPNLLENKSEDVPALAFMLGYRYQANNGLLFKIYPEFIPAIFPDEDSWGHLPFLGFALGYSF